MVQVIDPDEPVIVATSAGPTPVQREGITLVRLVYYILDIIIALLLLRFVLHLFGANPGNQLVAWVYTFTRPLVAPFTGIFPIVEQSAPLEWATIVAMIVYTLIAYAIARLVAILTRL